MIDRVVSGRYRVESQIGVGGMGIVYRAHDVKLRRDVALKVIAPHLVEDEEARARFLREAQALAGLSHPNIVTVFDLSEDLETNTVFIVMELLNGSPLRKRITDPERPDFYDMAIQVCRALEHAHSHGILHRDIKPENIFVCTDGTLKLMDFGLARLVDGVTVSTSGMVTGTVAYMAPEQLRGGVLDPRADLYAVGVLFYEYLSGFTPFMSDSPGTMLLKHLTEPPPSLRLKIPGISEELDALIQTLLAKEAGARYPSAIVLRDSLERIRARSLALATPQFTGQATASESHLPLVAPKPKSTRSAADLARPVRNVQRDVGRLVAVFCVLLLGAILAFAFGETLQRMFVPNPETPKKQTIAKKAATPKKPTPANSRQRRSRRYRRPGGASNPDTGAHPAKPADTSPDPGATQPGAATANDSTNPDAPSDSRSDPPEPDPGSDTKGGSDT